MRVAADGELIELVDVDGAIERMAKFLEQSHIRPSADVRELFDDPTIRGMFDQKIAETWSIWCSAFTYLDLPVGETEVTSVDQPLGAGDLTVPIVYRRTCITRLEDRGIDCVELEVIQEPDEQGMTEAIREFLSKHVENPVPPDEVANLNVRRITTIRGIFQVATLRPHRVTYELHAKFREKGVDQERFDLRSFEFAW